MIFFICNWRRPDQKFFEEETMTETKSLSERADELEEQQIRELENLIATRSVLYQLADGEQPHYKKRALKPGQHLLMGEDPRLPKMPNKPTLIDFVKLRFSIGGQQHLLQSGRLAKINGLNPNPGAWFKINNERYKVWKARISSLNGQPGKVLDEKLIIACKDKSIEIIEIQKEGKNKQNIDKFLLGNKIKKGLLLI